VLKTVVQAHHENDVVPRLIIANHVHDLQRELLDPRIAVIGQAIGLHPFLDLIDLDVPLAIPFGLGRFLPRDRPAKWACRQKKANDGAAQGTNESGLF